jgi:hypothetical protein
VHIGRDGEQRTQRPRVVVERDRTRREPTHVHRSTLRNARDPSPRRQGRLGGCLRCCCCLGAAAASLRLQLQLRGKRRRGVLRSSDAGWRRSIRVGAARVDEAMRCDTISSTYAQVQASSNFRRSLSARSATGDSAEPTSAHSSPIVSREPPERETAPGVNRQRSRIRPPATISATPGRRPCARRSFDERGATPGEGTVRVDWRRTKRHRQHELFRPGLSAAAAVAAAAAAAAPQLQRRPGAVRRAFRIQPWRSGRTCPRKAVGSGKACIQPPRFGRPEKKLTSACRGDEKQCIITLAERLPK